MNLVMLDVEDLHVVEGALPLRQLKQLTPIVQCSCKIEWRRRGVER